MTLRRATLAVVTISLALAGCAPAEQPTTPSAAQSATPPAEQPAGKLAATDAAPADPELMSLSDRRSQIASNFPSELPVVAGTVIRGQAQGPDAWDYVVESPRDPQTVATWYQRLYLARNWQLVSDEGYGDGGISLTYRKGAAESRITIEPIDGGTRASVIVGVGVPVTQTQ